jgi:hypothetical protein
VSFERAYAELNKTHGHAAASTVEALMFTLRRGVSVLTSLPNVTTAVGPSLSDTLRWLAALDKNQLKEVCRRTQKFNPKVAPAWSRDDVDVLVATWRRLHER